MSAVTQGANRTLTTGAMRARRNPLGLTLTRIGIIVFCLIVLMPVFWVITASIQPGSSAFSSNLFPSTVSLENYQAIINAGFWVWLKNSLIICTVAGIISLSINTSGAFAFSRLRFSGRRYGLMLLLMLQAFPAAMALAAIYTLLIKVNLLDTLPGILLVYIGASAFNMWLLKNFMDSIPRELDESAYVDGATSFRIFWQIILPLMRPILATVFIMSFYGTYNEFMLASLILQSPGNYTVIVGLYHLIAGQYATNWAQFAAGAVMASLPICIIFLSLQKQLVAGLTSGAVKG